MKMLQEMARTIFTMTGQYSILDALISWLSNGPLLKLSNLRNGGSVPAAVPRVSSPSVPATTVPAGHVNGHENTVEDVPAPPTAHAEPNGFDEFDPRGSVPGIVCSVSAINTPLV
jgi:hypothetical protein